MPAARARVLNATERATVAAVVATASRTAEGASHRAKAEFSQDSKLAAAAEHGARVAATLLSGRETWDGSARTTGAPQLTVGRQLVGAQANGREAALPPQRSRVCTREHLSGDALVYGVEAVGHSSSRQAPTGVALLIEFMRFEALCRCASVCGVPKHRTAPPPALTPHNVILPVCKPCPRQSSGHVRCPKRPVKIHAARCAVSPGLRLPDPLLVARQHV